MIVKIDANMSREEIDAALKRLQKSKNKHKLSDFYGKLKGVFGDAMKYQKRLR